MENFNKLLFDAKKKHDLGEILEIVSELSQMATIKGKLDRKTKEMIILGLALHKDCHRCIDIHTKEAIRLGVGEPELTQVQKIVLFYRASPGCGSVTWESWRNSWHEFSLSKGSVNSRTRELIALAISMVEQCEPHIDYHTENAIRYGSTSEEIVELIPITLLMDGAPAISQIPVISQYIEKHTHD